MNQVNFHASSGRYLLANYGFIDLNGLPRPWHQPPILPQHRTQLTMFEAPKPWGPFSVFHRDDNWASPDGSTGAYCPVLPAKWLQANEAWVVFAQCCAGMSNNHYAFSTQRFSFKTNA